MPESGAGVGPHLRVLIVIDWGWPGTQLWRKVLCNRSCGSGGLPAWHFLCMSASSGREAGPVPTYMQQLPGAGRPDLLNPRFRNMLQRELMSPAGVPCCHLADAEHVVLMTSASQTACLKVRRVQLQAQLDAVGLDVTEEALACGSWGHLGHHQAEQPLRDTGTAHTAQAVHATCLHIYATCLHVYGYIREGLIPLVHWPALVDIGMPGRRS